MNSIIGRQLFLAAAVAFVLHSAAAQNAWRIVDESGEITLISNGRLKQAWGDDALIMLGPENKVIFLSSEKEAYAQGTPEQYCLLMKEVQGEMIAKLPEDQRSMIEGMRGKNEPGKAPKVFVKHQGSGGTVAGLATEKYAIIVEGKLYEEVWLATDPDFLEHFRPLVSIFRGFSQCVSSMSMKDEVESSEEYLDLYAKGIEVRVRRADSAEEEPPETGTKIDRVTVADSEFAIPAGYSKMELREFVYGQMGGMDDQ
jgi:hypothetical protein